MLAKELDERALTFFDTIARAGSDDEQARALKRARLVWTPALHRRFVDAVSHLGIKNAVPKTIMQMMNVDGLSRENVASHLQKYRLYLKRLQGCTEMTMENSPGQDGEDRDLAAGLDGGNSGNNQDERGCGDDDEYNAVDDEDGAVHQSDGCGKKRSREETAAVTGSP